MEIRKAVRVALFVAINALLLMSPAATAAWTVTTKEVYWDGGPYLAIIADSAGWQVFDPIPFNDEDTVAYSGAYRSNGPDGAGTALAWLSDPKLPGGFEAAKVYYVISNGVITYTGFFKSFAHGTVPVVQLPIKVNGSDGFGASDPPYTPPVPEPKEYLMMLLGFGMVAYQTKRIQRFRV